MNLEQSREEAKLADDTADRERKVESEPVKLRDSRGRLEWLREYQEQEVLWGMKINNNARTYLEFLSRGLESDLGALGPRPENRNGLHLLRMLEGIAGEFTDLKLTDTERKLTAQAVDEIKRRTLDNHNDEDPNLRDDINARMMQLYTFLKTIEGNHS